ncbi:signal peptidase I [Sporichthya sp.]|uniref:signal peptidase I n=1 Tax=Sporichthya sp. TaxID=65475 RepID=UPI0017F179B5|nr:signal peptidase I [Sporichthya sp.]MBA3744437.1 signal peptidase I [Sporichthya sp.]
MDTDRDDGPAVDDLAVASALTAVRTSPSSHRRAPAPRRAAANGRALNGAESAGGRAELRAARRRKLRRIQAFVVVGLLVMMTIVRGLMFQAFSIPSVSMEPTLLVGDRVLVNKMSYDVGSLQRGQVVVFDGAGSFVPERTDSPGLFSRTLGAIGLNNGEDDYVKRVIGLPGDRVACCDAQGRLTVNGVPLDEPYLFELDLPSRDRFDILVPPGRVWVMGDHRSRSADSRAHLGDPGGGTVPIDKIVGRAMAIVWPLGRAGWLPIPESFERLTNGGAPGE